jgi:uncharacterized protein YraI
MNPKPLFFIAVAVLLPLTAAAQEAQSTKWVNLRAGPARDYPLVASFGPGTPLAVQGCTQGFAWCDVIGPGGVRGWIYAGNIAYPYQNSEVPVLTYGASIGFPIVTFAIGSYWGQYYRNRLWVGSQGRWAHHRPPMPPRPGIRPPGLPRPVMRPPVAPRPPGVRPPGERPSPGARPPEGQPPGGGRPPAGGPGRPVGEERPQQR